MTDVDELMAVLASVREAGHAEDQEEYVEGCRCVAVPISGRDGTAVAAMSVSMPAFRCDDDQALAHLKRLRATAQRLQRLTSS